MRTTEDKELRLGSYEMFHRGEPLTETVWEKLMLGLSTRKYGQAVREFTEAYGLEKSAVSEHFIEASREKLKKIMERRLASTNVIESAFSIVEQVCRNVKRWHGGDQRERWVGSGLFLAEKQFRRIIGHKQIPNLIRELESLTQLKAAVVKRKKAS